MLLKDKVAIITGATRGIGREILYRLAEEGAKVIGLYANNDTEAKKIQNDFIKRGLSVDFYKGSVVERSYINFVFNEVKEKYGKIDILINNAGITRDNFITQMNEEDWKKVIETNFLGTYTCCTEVIPYMLAQKYGKVINMVSVTGVVGREAQVNYGTSKGAMIGLTRLLSRRYAQEGIYFNTIAPGLIQTEMIDTVPEHKIDNFLQYTNLKRVGTTKEVANAAVYLSSELSDYVSDVVLKVDGGFCR
ncbi:3-oxoacyl-ACP reductase FabG [Bacillus albus]|uniref:3-oxoacyl-ACP reductase n=1 Tax=Bacillus thuringiensis serovar vazensis TaxID=180867 RepID=A0A243CYC9_BACTU|nr:MULTISPECIES: 3-oxoacyl-ACP reductase family protein [Bacillus cereus group]KXO04408.1 3-oxoacyl-ACP reductase [Bacillus thuringiensis]EEM86327.1 3-oxoacyl-(Acyl-carrier protein) reductase [Bacillus thuringiensis serovar pulsiensis BGSC 4CC1]MBU5220657.1 3-oxoacyl-ACP reductase FabG [Bacillus albus]MBZ4223028.1 3-oxoacyl-ACP reductase FabG [Bacillus wiedmannii]OTY75203.1 3-oxoacyl-ACP reductase [Bacillus thuringiensis serovar vazensis]